MTDSRITMGPSEGFSLRPSACDGRGCFHGFSMAGGGKDFPLGFTPVVGGCFIFEGDFSGGGEPFGDLIGSLLGMFYEKKL